MKKIFIFLFLSVLIQMSPKGFDLSVGGSYRLGLSYEYDFLTGFYQNFSIPFSFTYYPREYYNNFSIGFRNRIGYGLIINDSNKMYYTTEGDAQISFAKVPLEHEIYENISFIFKIGNQVKFVQGTGLTFKYSFLNVPDKTIYITTHKKEPDMYFHLIDSGDYQYFSLGPAFDINLEILNLARNFSFMIGMPFEFIFTTFKMPSRLADTEKEDGEIVIKTSYIDRNYFNFTFGVEFSFCFNYFKEFKE